MFQESADRATIGLPGMIFDIVLPQDWGEHEKYDFDWESLRNEPEPFQVFPFT